MTSFDTIMLASIAFFDGLGIGVAIATLIFMRFRAAGKSGA